MSKKKTSREELTDLMSTWDLRVSQAQRDDRLSPGAEREFRETLYIYVADALRVVAKECDKWTRRCDDAKRIPDVIREHATFLAGDCRKASQWSSSEDETE